MYIPSKSKFRKEPWMLPNLLKCVRKQKLLYQKALQDNANVELWNKYKEYCNVLTGIKRRCKQDYYLQKCVEFKDNTKKLWHIINQMNGKLNDKSSIIDCIRDNDTLHYSPEKITNAFGNYFCTIGKKMASKIKKPKTEISKYISKINMNEKTMFWVPATKLEIVKLIDSLPNKRSSGFDNVDNKLLKAIKLEISEPLLFISNQSSKLGVFPEKMKLAEVFPLHKSKERELLSNYRPISLLITVSKLLEKLVYARTYNFLNATGQIFRSQYRFCNAHSCENAIQELFSMVFKGKENKCYTMSIFLDLSKAFDTISHTVLFSKLNKYGIRGTCLDWYRSYLANRKIWVKCVTSASGQLEYSDVYNIKFGTPQGSCLGPLIFLIFNNDLYMHLQYCQCILFADNTTIYHTHKNLRHLEWCIKEDLDIISDWFNANQLTLNLNKTVCMLFAPNMKNVALPEKIDFNGRPIPVVKSTKFLGVHINDKLSFHEHFNSLVIKLKRNINMLKCSKHHLSTHGKKILYYGHIYSHISYCIGVWGSILPDECVKKLQKLQNKCIMLVDLNRIPLENKYKTNKIL